MNKLIGKTVEIAIAEGIFEVKNKIIQDSTHTNAMYQHISLRQELIKQAKELRKSVYKVDETMHDKTQNKETKNLHEETIHKQSVITLMQKNVSVVHKKKGQKQIM